VLDVQCSILHHNMADSQNILDKFENFNVKYILLGFSNTTDACSTNLGPDVGPPGTVFSGNGCGKSGIVIVNEFEDFSYTIDNFQSEFNFYSDVSIKSTQMIAILTIADRLGGQFPTFLRDCAAALGVSETHIAFQLKIYFTGFTKNGGNVDTYVTKPFIFNMGSLSQLHTTVSAHLYSLQAIATYNTFGLLNGFTKMYQSTITSADKNPSKEIPTPESPTSTILPRGDEDAFKNNSRKKRIDKSKPMETLEEVFKGLAEDLQQQKYEHKRQLQEWLSFVRDDFVKKIEQPKQKKPPGYLPLEYKIVLDPEYKSYKIDNRNMPFEQPEQNQEKYGVRSIPIPEGENVIDTIERIMKYSRKIGTDGDTIPKYTFRVVSTVMKNCEDKYEITINIKKIILPQNEPGNRFADGIDTGPGTAVDPITLEFQKAGTSDIDVYHVVGKTASLVELEMMEKQVDDSDAEVVFANREQATAERTPSLDFFHSMFSGVRTNLNNKNNGLESAEDAGKVDILSAPTIAPQNNKFQLKIRGNPELLSDIFRNPVKVKTLDDDSPRFYPNPEYSPMYVKVILYLSPLAGSLGITPDDSSPIYYYEKYQHLYKIVTTISGNIFDQHLHMLRSDDAT